MIKYLLPVVLIWLSLQSQARACSIVMPPPAEEFRQSHLVALARPLAISYRPKNAGSPGFAGSFRQTILWQVLLSWKGGIKSGKTFTTRRTFSDDPEGCSSYFPIRSKEAMLVFSQGQEPFSEFHVFDLSYAQPYFSFLEQQQTK